MHERGGGDGRGRKKTGEPGEAPGDARVSLGESREWGETEKKRAKKIRKTGREMTLLIEHGA